MSDDSDDTNQYGGGDEDIDAVEQTDRMDDEESSDESDDEE